MNKLMLPFLIMTTTFVFCQTDSVIISGKVTDFNGIPIDGVLIMIKGENFSQYIDTTYSDKTGQYSLRVKKGKYKGMAAVKMEDYSKTKLEFWAYEVPANKNINLDITNIHKGL